MNESERAESNTETPVNSAEHIFLAPVRRNDGCPLCRTSTESVFELECTPNPPLPDSIEFHWCAHCDFIFAQNLDAGSYNTVYSSHLNDTGHVSNEDSPSNLSLIQAALLTDQVGNDFCGSCLDFGCGEGQLLERLCRLLPRANLFGMDLRNSLKNEATAKFLDDWSTAPARFDLIVVSHVAEHLVDMTAISMLTSRLAPGGLLYIEVPDPLGYLDCPRREFMYYFDRLHVNHFSHLSLTRWLAPYEVEIVRFGTHRFAYRDGMYPAQFVFARSGVMLKDPPESNPSLLTAFESYRKSETLRGRNLRHFILERAAGRDLLVYGGGTNFSRARSPGGPLHQLPIKAILDRQAGSLAGRVDLPVVTPAQGLKEHPEAIVLVTVSVGSEEIIDDIQRHTPNRTIIMI